MNKYILLGISLINLTCATQNQKKSKLNDLKNSIRSQKNIVFQNITFEDEINFTSFLNKNLIGLNVYSVDIRSSITFIDCIFEKSVVGFAKERNNTTYASVYGNLSFIKCKFRNEVNFRGINIYGRADFRNSSFKDRVNFEEATFHQNAYFDGGKFEKEIRFQNSFFIKKANFFDTEYFGAASFQNAIFNLDLQLVKSKFHKYADFSLIDCRGNSLFNYCEFYMFADFSNSNFRRGINFIHTKNKNTDFHKCKFMDEANFTNATVTEFFNFENSFFLLGKPNFDLSNEQIKID